MKWHELVRIVALIAIVGVFYIYSTGRIALNPLILTLLSIVALVSPEAIDSLPFGPVKKT